MNFGSIRFRLAAWYTGFLAVTFLVLGFGAWAAIRASIYDTVDADLHSRILRITGFLAHFDADPKEIAEELEEQEVLTSAGTLVRFDDLQGHPVFRSAGPAWWGSSIPRGEGIQTFDTSGSRLRVHRAELASGRIEIAVPLDMYDTALRRFSWTMLLGSPVALLLASFGGYWMSRRALAPVDAIAARAREIGTGELSARLPSRNSGDELDRLSATLNEMLERIENGFRRITQFTADASHELRTPVAIIRTTAEIARSRTRSAEQHEASWASVVSESERMSRLLEDLMTLARADSGMDRLDSEAVDLSVCLEDACSEIQVLAESASITLLQEIEPGCGLKGDAEALRRLCLIFLDNAVKYTPACGTIRAMLERDGDSLVLSIADTGIGISGEDQERIFDRFYRASSHRSRESGGTGLGLAIAKWIAARHQAVIEVTSVAGAGSTFRIIFPAFTALSGTAATLVEQEVSL